MISALYLLAIVCALLGAWKGDRTAWALLAGTALTSALTASGVPFMPRLWFGIDLAVIAGIVLLSKGRRARDVAVIVLFFPAWPLYVSDAPYSGDATGLLVSLQLLLTVPFAALWRRMRRTRGQNPGQWTEFDLMVRA
jgi:hypothetical protein